MEKDKKCNCLDMVMTGEILRRMMYQNGYSIKDIQEELHLACPQSIYRWIKGQAMPTIDNLYILSDLFGVHMEDMLMPRQDDIWTNLEPNQEENWNYNGRMTVLFRECNICLCHDKAL